MDIGDALFISRRTVATHVRHIYRSWEWRLEAGRDAICRGLVYLTGGSAVRCGRSLDDGFPDFRIGGRDHAGTVGSQTLLDVVPCLYCGGSISCPPRLRDGTLPSPADDGRPIVKAVA